MDWRHSNKHARTITTHLPSEKNPNYHKNGNENDHDDDDDCYWWEPFGLETSTHTHAKRNTRMLAHIDSASHALVLVKSGAVKLNIKAHTYITHMHMLFREYCVSMCVRAHAYIWYLYSDIFEIHVWVLIFWGGPFELRVVNFKPHKCYVCLCIYVLIWACVRPNRVVCCSDSGCDCSRCCCCCFFGVRFSG